MNIINSNQFIFVLSLVLAIFALSVNAWRAETTETNLNLRMAGFEIFWQLNLLEQITHQVQFGPDIEPNNREYQLIVGWSHLMFLADLSKLMPQDVELSIQTMQRIWEEHSLNIGKNKGSSPLISEANDACRHITHQPLADLA